MTSPSTSEAINIIRKYAPNFVPKLGIILGSGLSSLAEQLVNPITIPYQAFGFTSGSVAGHASLLMLGMLNDVPVACLKGRLHIYEGIPYSSVCALIRIVKHLGAHALIITGAAGSTRAEMGPGELMMLNDHINFQPGNPLVGPNDESEGPRFVSLEDAYDPALRVHLANTAKQLSINLHEGVYLSTLGPSFETPAEVRMFKAWGADALGMSVVPEVIAARHCGLRVVGVAAITNLAVGLSPEVVSHEGTLQQGEIAGRKLIKIIPEFVKKVGPNLGTGQI